MKRLNPDTPDFRIVPNNQNARLQNFYRLSVILIYPIAALMLIAIISCSDKTEWIEPYTSSSSSEIVSSSSEEVSSSSSEAISSSSVEDLSSSSGEESVSSSSIEEDVSSSSVADLSSSSVESSSSSIAYVLTCAGLPANGTAGTAITPPTVKCNGVDVEDYEFSGHFNWDAPIAANYAITVKAKSGNCSDTEILCGQMTVINPKCTSGEEYTPGTEDCCDGVKYTKSTHACMVGHGIYEICEGDKKTIIVNPDEFCYKDKIEQKCGGNRYELDTQYCYGGAVKNRCGGSRKEEYDQEKYRCEGNKIYLKDEPVDADGKTYKAVLIGTQTWMAENLNLAVDGSMCYDDNIDNCEIYGRLYDWVTAMALTENCYDEICSSQIDDNHQGICPVGWHIFDKAEWETLMTAIGYNNSDRKIDTTERLGYDTIYYAGKYLKTTDRWTSTGGVNTNGTDDYGFAALPAGHYSTTATDGKPKFRTIGTNARWWSKNERLPGTSAERWFIQDDIRDKVIWGSNNKTVLQSVRCVMDD